MVPGTENPHQTARITYNETEILRQPSLQCAALEVRDDELMTKGLLERLNHMGEERTRHEYNRPPHQPPTTYVSTGYLNFHDHYKDLLLSNPDL